MRHKYQIIIAIILVIFGIVLLIIAFFMPPAGVIDPTVLTAYGETLTFSGSLIGLDYHYRAKSINYGSTKLTTSAPLTINPPE